MWQCFSALLMCMVQLCFLCNCVNFVNLLVPLHMVYKLNNMILLKYVHVCLTHLFGSLWKNKWIMTVCVRFAPLNFVCTAVVHLYSDWWALCCEERFRFSECQCRNSQPTQRQFSELCRHRGDNFRLVYTRRLQYEAYRKQLLG